MAPDRPARAPRAGRARAGRATARPRAPPPAGRAPRGRPAAAPSRSSSEVLRSSPSNAAVRSLSAASDAEHRAEQRGAGDELGVQRRDRGGHRRLGRATSWSRPSRSCQTPRHAAYVACRASAASPVTTGTPSASSGVGELADQPGLAGAGLGLDDDAPAARPSRASTARAGSASSGSRPTMTCEPGRPASMHRSRPPGRARPRTCTALLPPLDLGVGQLGPGEPVAGLRRDVAVHPDLGRPPARTISRAARFTASPRQQNVRRSAWP